VIGAVFGNHVRMARQKPALLIAQLLLLAAAVCLSACHKDAGDAAASAPAPVKPKAPVAARSGPTVAEQTATMVDAAVQGKSQLPVQLKFELAQRPKVGQALELSLALIPQIDASAAGIKLTGGDGLTVPADGTDFTIPSAAAGEIYRQTVHVTPDSEGVLLLGVSVWLKHDEVTDLKTFSIPLIADR
jgi:hypothetical protein